MPAFRANIHGRVQGVGFRWFVAEQARQLQLRGEVRNCPSGSEVEVLAEGPEADLQALLKALRRGPAFSRVIRVDVEWRDESGSYGEFRIAH